MKSFIKSKELEGYTIELHYDECPLNPIEEFNNIDEDSKIYKAYLEGEVYGFIVKDKKGKVIDSCWGYYGNLNDCMTEGIAIAERCIEQDKIGMKLFHALA